MYAMIALLVAGHRVTWKTTNSSAVPHYNKKMIREEIHGEFRGDSEEGMKKGAIRSA